MSQAMLMNQLGQLENPDGRIMLEARAHGRSLLEIANSQQGITTGDLKRFGLAFWELNCTNLKGYRLWQSTPNAVGFYHGRSLVVKWDVQGHAIEQVAGATLRGKDTEGRIGVVVGLMRDLPVALSTGELCDDNTARILPDNSRTLPAIWCFCKSEEFLSSVRALNQKLSVAPHTLVKVPFDLEHWQKIAQLKYPDGLPEPLSDDPTQWLFKGDIPSSSNPLQVALARLLNNSWPDQIDDGLSSHLDADGIVTLAPLVNQEGLANRLRDLLQVAYESPAPERPKGAPDVVEPRVWEETTLPRLLANAGSPGMNLEDWLRDKFFDAHCKLFHQRPFIWHIWDGRKDGFHAFVNYHLLDSKNLDNLTHVYLGEWVERQKQALESGNSSAETRLIAAQALQQKLEHIRVGEKPYDIFIRWKTLAEQPLGWEPDLNDGVRMNIRPFVEAGVLRSRVNVNWNLDRGKDPKPNASGTVERHNDLHFSLAEKRAARGDK